MNLLKKNPPPKITKFNRLLIREAPPPSKNHKSLIKFPNLPPQADPATHA